MICLQVQEILDEDEALSTDPSQGRQRTRRVLAMRHIRYCCGQMFFFFFNLSDGSITNAKSAVSNCELPDRCVKNALCAKSSSRYLLVQDFARDRAFETSPILLHGLGPSSAPFTDVLR